MLIFSLARHVASLAVLLFVMIFFYYIGWLSSDYDYKDVFDEAQMAALDAYGDRGPAYTVSGGWGRSLMDGKIRTLPDSFATPLHSNDLPRSSAYRTDTLYWNYFTRVSGTVLGGKRQVAEAARTRKERAALFAAAAEGRRQEMLAMPLYDVTGHMRDAEARRLGVKVRFALPGAAPFAKALFVDRAALTHFLSKEQRWSGGAIAYLRSPRQADPHLYEAVQTNLPAFRGLVTHDAALCKAAEKHGIPAFRLPPLPYYRCLPRREQQRKRKPRHGLAFLLPKRRPYSGVEDIWRGLDKSQAVAQPEEAAVVVAAEDYWEDGYVGEALVQGLASGALLLYRGGLTPALAEDLGLRKEGVWVWRTAQDLARLLREATPQAQRKARAACDFNAKRAAGLHAAALFDTHNVACLFEVHGARDFAPE